MVDLHLVIPVLNFSTLDPGILINGATSQIDDVLTEHGGLIHVLPLAVRLRFLLLDNQRGPF